MTTCVSEFIKKNMRAKCTRYLLGLAAILLMLLSPHVARSQNSVANLAGTEWSTKGELIPTANIDYSTTTLTRYLVFREHGKVEAHFDTYKTAGTKMDLVTEYVTESVYNGATGTYDYRTVPRQVQKQVMTLPEFHSGVWKGTYEIRENKAYLDFPNCTIEAKIVGNLLTGLLTYKGSKEQESWLLSPLTAGSSATNTAASGGSDKTLESEVSTESAAEYFGKFNLRKRRWTALIGLWRGTYTCGQGLTNLSLTIFRPEKNLSKISAVFEFNSFGITPGHSGSFRMTGTYDSLANQMSLKATDWINQPAGYTAVDLVGALSEGKTKLSGNVLFAGCTTFSLEKK